MRVQQTLCTYTHVSLWYQHHSQFRYGVKFVPSASMLCSSRKGLSVTSLGWDHQSAIVCEKKLHLWRSIFSRCGCRPPEQALSEKFACLYAWQILLCMTALRESMKDRRIYRKIPVKHPCLDKSPPPTFQDIGKFHKTPTSTHPQFPVTLVISALLQAYNNAARHVEFRFGGVVGSSRCSDLAVIQRVAAAAMRRLTAARTESCVTVLPATVEATLEDECMDLTFCSGSGFSDCDD